MSTTVRWCTRLVGAGMLGATAGIHLSLYRQGYSGIHVIGPLFLLAGVMGSLLCLAVLLAPSRLLPLAAIAGVGFEAGILVGLVLATERSAGVFGFKESTAATYYWQAVVVEAVGIVGLTLLTGITVNRRAPVAVRGV